MKTFTRLALAMVLAGAIAAGTALATGTGRAAGTTVGVKVREMRIIPARLKVPAGRVTFQVRNVGTIDHELVVIRANGRAALPVHNYRAEEGRAVVGEADDVAPGHAKRVTLALTPGRYFLICNIPGHYQLGMSALLRVVSGA